MKNTTILHALRIISKLEPNIIEIPHTSNRNFIIFSDSPANIPHYIKINYRNTSINLLIAIPGRRQACQTCGSTRHWTSQCQWLSEEANQVHTTANTTTETVTNQKPAASSKDSTMLQTVAPVNTIPATQPEKTNPLPKDNTASKTPPPPTQQEMETQ